MFVELIESLRCPRSHDESPLIASATTTEARHIVEGVLGCPACGEEFAIVAGELHIDPDAPRGAPEAPSDETAMRLAAFLELTDPGGPAILMGHWASHADRVRQLTQSPVVLLNAPSGLRPDAAASIVSRESVPFATGSARGAALDPAMSDALRGSVLRVVRGGGRVVADAALELPDGVTEIVRDAHMWVGEKTAAPDATPRLVPLSRKPK